MVIQRWLIKADDDLRSSKSVLDEEPPITATACFHAQQCVEKCLKAFLVYVDRHVEKIHALKPLVELCGEYDEDFLDFTDIAEELTDYAIEIRYPDDWREIPIEEAVAAVENAEKIMVSVRQKLNL